MQVKKDYKKSSYSSLCCRIQKPKKYTFCSRMKKILCYSLNPEEMVLGDEFQSLMKDWYILLSGHGWQTI